jgi:hypothetical protein
VKIEANGDYIGTAPTTLKIFGDKDGTFHSFGSRDYVVRAIPSRPGELPQEKVFHTGSWFSQEDIVPKRIFFQMEVAPASSGSTSVIERLAAARESTVAAPEKPLPRSAIIINQSETVPKLMLFAGPSHETYLGCLNCGSEAPDSILNESGTHGSTMSQESIWNKFSQFGGHFGIYSPFNQFSQDPPVIVDAAGSFYGRFTMNTLRLDRTKIETFNALLEKFAEGQ